MFIGVADHIARRPWSQSRRCRRPACRGQRCFHRWRSPDEILEHHGLLVYPREGFKDHLASTIYHGHPGIKIVTDAPVMPISATRIREDIRAWRPVEDRVAPAVLSYIRQHGLYLH